MNRDEKLNILKEKNPFTSSSVGDPREGKYPDVESVNENAFEMLCQLIRQKAADPAQSIAGLVLGEVGSGRTHLISRILEYGSRFEPPFPFVYIQPIEDPGQTYRYLLREVIANLCHPMDEASDMTHLDRILAEIFKEEIEKIFRPSDLQKHARFLSKLLKDPTNIFRNNMMTPAVLEYVGKISLKFMTLEYPKFPDNFLKVLFQYRIPEKRLASVNWLKGSVIDDEETSLLGVPGRQNRSDMFLEQETRSVLNALGVLMARYRQLMILCFDQLGNLETDEQIHSLGKMVAFLADTAKAMLPIACFRTLQWNNKFKKKLDQHVVSKLQTNAYDIGGCTPEQALALIRSRLAYVLGEDQENDLFPFDKHELIKTFQSGLENPGKIITQANWQLRAILDKRRAEPLSSVEQLEDEFESLYQNILSDFKRCQPDREHLRRTLELFLAHNAPQNKFNIESLSRPGDKEKYIDMMCIIRSPGSQPVKAVFIIDIEQNHASVERSLREGISFFNRHPSGKAFYIRDTRSAFPMISRWTDANEMLEHFMECGGHIIFLDDKQAARWYALALLNYAVKEGDFTIFDAGRQVKFVSSAEFASFIREKIHGKKYPVFRDFGKALGASPAGGSSAPLSDEDAE